MAQIGNNYEEVPKLTMYIMASQAFDAEIQFSSLIDLDCIITCSVRNRQGVEVLRFEEDAGLVFSSDAGTVGLIATAAQTSKLLDHVSLQYDIRVVPTGDSPFYVVRGSVIVQEAITRT